MVNQSCELLPVRTPLLLHCNLCSGVTVPAYAVLDEGLSARKPAPVRPAFARALRGAAGMWGDTFNPSLLPQSTPQLSVFTALSQY